MEPDHSGAISFLLKLFPHLRIVANQKTIPMLSAYVGDVDCLQVADGEILDLGRKFQFFLTPMLHWPETMMTYLPEDKVLFSGDAFGTFGALKGIYDVNNDLEIIEREALRYYSNIVGKYSNMAITHCLKLRTLDIRAIAPTHGPIWEEKASFILNNYLKWANQSGENGVVIVYASMYGHTMSLAQDMAFRLNALNIYTELYDVSRTDPSDLFARIWKYGGLVLASCTYNGGAFFPMESLLNKMLRLGVKNKKVAIISCYTWADAALKVLREFVVKTNFELLGEVALKVGSRFDFTEMAGRFL
jgi:flavorubredoxin